MQPDAWVTVAVIVVLVVILVRELVTPAAAILGALVTLVLAGVVEPAVALGGFASTATATVAGLFVVAAAIEQHAGLGRGVEGLLSRSGSERGVLVRLCSPVAGSSALVANTPIVAALAPIVRAWAERTGRPPSRVLMPLSFAAVLGGLVTTIGTSTTLVASGIVSRATGESFGFLEVTPLGLPVAVLGLAVLVLLAPVLVPDRGAAFSSGMHDYVFRMVVEPEGPLDGMSVEDAGLRHLDEVFVAEIERGEAATIPARPDARLRGGDVLVITGSAEHAADLPRDGLHHAAQPQVDALGVDRTGLHEVVVGQRSELVGRTLKDLSFRGRYTAAVLSIARADTRLAGKLGVVPLAAGDVLLLRATEGFTDRWRGTGDFALVARIDEQTPTPSSRRPLVVGITLLMVVLAATGVTSLLVAVLWACALLAVTGTIAFRDALESLDLDVLLIIASAIGIGATVETSGLAATIATRIGRVADGTSSTVALLLLLLATALLTEVVTNVASAALLVPIAMSTATAVGEDPRGWAIAVAIGASASFLTPIGYQTNTIVYGLGGYRFGDFWRLGLPIVLVVMTTTLVVVPLVWD